MRRILHLALWQKITGQVMLLLLLGLMSGQTFAQTEISTEQGLKAIANDLAGSYKLTADITLSEAWVPIGTSDAPFTGTIDGNGHIISGLSFNNSSTDRVGFIGASKGATITKLGLEKANIIGNADAGAIVGTATENSTISECYVANSYIEGRDHVGSIAGAIKSGSTVSNSYGSAYVYSRSYQAGGVVGIIDGASVDKCYFAGSIAMDGSSSNVGGITSLLDGGDETTNIVTNSVNLAPYMLGGQVNRIIGNLGGRSATLANNYARADVLCGATIDDAVEVSTEDENYGAGAIQGVNVSAADSKTTAFYKNTLGWDMETIWSTTGEGQIYPTLKWQTVPFSFDQLLNVPTEEVKLNAGAPATIKIFSAFDQAVSYTSSNESVVSIASDGTVNAKTAGTVTFTVSTAGSDVIGAVSATFTVTVIAITGDVASAEDLNNIRYKLDGDYTLTSDITLTEDWTPIADFTGTLNGNGHIIHGLKYEDESTDAVGFFKSTSGATITKLGIEDANFVGNADVGGIVGSANDGTQISECYVANSYIEGRDHVGAIAGAAKSGSLISNCYATAEVYSRQYQAGGIAGILNEGAIDKCFFSGIVTIANGSSNAGGMTSLLDGGDAESNTISNSITLAPYLLGSTVCRILANSNGNEYTLQNNYARVDVKRGSTTNNLEGIGTDDENYGADLLHGANASIEDSKSKAFYQNTLTWDMDNIWNMVGEGEIYPILKWQTTPFTPSVLAIPEDVVIKKGASVKVKVYGSMGQSISYSSPQVDQIVNMWTEFDPETSEILFVLFGTDDESFDIGTATIEMTSEATSYMDQVVASFNVEVVDPASLLKNVSSIEELMAVNEDLIADYVLKANLDLTGIDWNPIGTDADPFKGSFDGNGYKITNLSSNRTSSNLIGLFGVANGATFTNIALENVNLNGSQDVGGLMGKGVGVQISKVYVTGVVEANDHVGSIVGGTYAGGTSNISNCYSTATVNTRNYQAGGLLGVASSTTIDKCYFSGTVESKAESFEWYHNAGGLIALVEDDNVFISNTVSAASSVKSGTANPYVARGTATITDCLYRSNMTLSDPIDESNAGEAMPDESDKRELSALYQKATYTGLTWDFTTVWKIETNQFPTLIGTGTNTAVKEIKTETKNYLPYVKNSTLHLSNVENAIVKVYNINGQLISNVVSYSTTSQIKLPATGIYIINILDAGKATGLKVINY